MTLASVDLLRSWAGQNAWTVLDANFQNGQRFLEIWGAWLRDPKRPRILHYVGIANALPNTTASAAAIEGALTAQSLQSFNSALHDRGPGFQRILLSDGQVSLTLCIGDLHDMLGEQFFIADTLFAAAPPDKWAVQLLARRCKRGTRFAFEALLGDKTVPDSVELADMVRVAGFEVNATASQHRALCGAFNPRWDIPTSRTPTLHVTRNPGRCAVVGAGIAGASVAHALALRGWQVTVFDKEASPAGGASGLPAGLAVPHVSADDNPRSRLSRTGIRVLTQHAERLLHSSQDWAPTGVRETCADASHRWHPQACWIKPTRLVQAWLSHSSIVFVGNTTVASIHPAGSQWTVRDAMEQDRGQFDIVVLANAMGGAALLHEQQAGAPIDAALRNKLHALQSMHGTLSHGTYAELLPGLPDFPVNGRGAFIPHVPGAAGEQWFAGSTFETDALAAADVATQHGMNMERLRHLVPTDGFDLADTLNRGPVAQWTSTRCVTRDRLPLVGPVHADANLGVEAGLWLCIGMGSRGLSFSALCAELLVARLHAEPLPMEFSLSKSLDVNRPQRQSPLKEASGAEMD